MAARKHTLSRRARLGTEPTRAAVATETAASVGGTRRVFITASATKQLGRIPPWIQAKLALWCREIETEGLEIVRRIPGFHDEPLRGRRRGQRSIRLNRAYRTFYTITNEPNATVQIEEVNKHEY